ncbi:MAG: DUF3048 domain-containing protein [Acidimicrobiia bacterium]|nr:DUF3048 domain-containing protein [Acidimicrobiia bacterium]
MKNIIRITATLFALVLLAVACGSDGTETAETTTSTTSTSSTTTTEAPTTTESTTTTTEEPALGPTYPLTGEPLEEGNSPDHPAVVVKISNNDATARAALLGLNEADIIFEERIEQSSTRFASVFHSVLPEEIGSVRSGRTSDVQIVSNLNRPIFAFSGANDGVHGQLRRAENDGLLVRASADFADPQFRRIGDFSAPNNLVVDAAALLTKAEDGEPPLPIFDYTDNVIALGGPSAGARVDASTPAFYVWSPEDGGYLRFQGDDPHMTRDGFQITPENVVVMSTTYVPSQIDASSVDAITVGSGPVVIYSGGFRVEGTWTREFERDPYTFTTGDGDIIGLAPGQTWVSLTPAGTSTELSLEQADGLR